MPIDQSKWERGCCAMTYQAPPNARGEIVLLTRTYGAELTRVEVYVTLSFTQIARQRYFIEMEPLRLN